MQRASREQLVEQLCDMYSSAASSSPSHKIWATNGAARAAGGGAPARGGPRWRLPRREPEGLRLQQTAVPLRRRARFARIEAEVRQQQRALLLEAGLDLLGRAAHLAELAPQRAQDRARALLALAQGLNLGAQVLDVLPRVVRVAVVVLEPARHGGVGRAQALEALVHLLRVRVALLHAAADIVQVALRVLVVLVQLERGHVQVLEVLPRGLDVRGIVRQTLVQDVGPGVSGPELVNGALHLGAQVPALLPLLVDDVLDGLPVGPQVLEVEIGFGQLVVQRPDLPVDPLLDGLLQPARERARDAEVIGELLGVVVRYRLGVAQARDVAVGLIHALLELLHGAVRACEFLPLGVELAVRLPEPVLQRVHRGARAGGLAS
mmetsp:Transcript_103712/g.293151  ORF Transcript_103712/g.293151 Transcript_103712/m.293151 type:complete len:378 (-) Transcript_103712:250-1383(-)